MNQDHQLILKKLISYDSSFVDKLDLYMKSEAYQYFSFGVFAQFALGKDDDKIDKFLDDFLDVNQYRIAPKKDSRDFLDQLHFDFRRMLEDLDSNLEDFDDYTSKVSTKFNNISYRIKKSGGFFSTPLSVTEVESFVSTLDQLNAVRTIINNYLAIACLIKKTFYFFPSETIIQILTSYKIKTSNFPNVLDTMKYVKTYYDFMFFSSLEGSK